MRGKIVWEKMHVQILSGLSASIAAGRRREERRRSGITRDLTSSTENVWKANEFSEKILVDF